MPSWAIHLAIATKLNKKLNISNQNKNIFLLGNLLPDILNGYIIKNISHTISHKETHIQKQVQIENHQEYRYDIDGFYEEHNKKFDNPLILGYYIHILTDFYWNNLSYGIKGIKDSEKRLIGLKLNNGKQLIASKEELRKTKANDFRLFSKYIYQNKLADIPYYDENMLEYAKEVTWLDLKKQDILETIIYLEEISSFKRKINIEDSKYHVFTEEEIKEHLNKCFNMLEQTLYNIYNNL